MLEICMTDGISATKRGWTKSSYSTACGACVEVKLLADSVFIRDSKFRLLPGQDASEPILSMPAADWERLLAPVASGSIPPDGPVALCEHPDGSADLIDQSGVTLRYTPAEWLAFRLGVRDGQFTLAVLASSATDR
jgi:Domain of unknown function (DUF397)